MSGQRKIRIAPSILDADLGHLAEQIATVESAGADLLHADVMDGHFVPNLSIGVPVVAAMVRHSRLPVYAHLMIADPSRYAPAFVKAGAKGITFHVEVAERPLDLIAQIRDLGAQVGVALNPGTPAEAVLDFVDQVDLVLVMTVWPGFGGQRFMAECLPKIEQIAGRLGAQQSLEVDGGVNEETVRRAVAAGADTLVAGSAIYHSADPGGEVVRLRQAAMEAAGAGMEQRA